MAGDEIWTQVVLIPKSMLLHKDDFSDHCASFFFFLISKTDALLFSTKSFLLVLLIEDSWSLLSDPQGEHVLGDLAGDPGPALLWEDIWEMKEDHHEYLRQKRDLFSLDY